MKFDFLWKNNVRKESEALANLDEKSIKSTLKTLVNS